jgi:folate-binding protein YgfZ
MSIMTASLGPTELLTVSGADAANFAHAQFTSDVRSLAVGAWQWSAWLDAQGRVRHFFALLHWAPAHLIAWLPLGGAEPMREALARYVMRSAVKLEASPDWALHRLEHAALAEAITSTQAVAHADGYAFALPGSARRLAWLAPGHSVPVDVGARDRWRLDDIAAGLPLLAPELGGEFVPQALDLERLDAIRFDKGCYPGQEIAARLHFRGGNKRHLQRLRVNGAAPAIGENLLDDDGQSAGQVLYAAPASTTTSEALAVLTRTEARNLTTAHSAHVEIVL